MNKGEIGRERKNERRRKRVDDPVLEDGKGSTLGIMIQ